MFNEKFSKFNFYFRSCRYFLIDVPVLTFIHQKHILTRDGVNFPKISTSRRRYSISSISSTLHFIEIPLQEIS